MPLVPVPLLVLVRARVSVQLPLEEASPPKGLAWELPVARELSALWVQEKLGV